MSIINTDYYRYAVDNEIPLKYLYVNKQPVMDMMQQYIQPESIITAVRERFPPDTITQPGVFGDAYAFLATYPGLGDAFDTIMFLRWIYRDERITLESHIIPLMQFLGLDEEDENGEAQLRAPVDDYMKRFDLEFRREIAQDRLYLDRYNGINAALDGVVDETFVEEAEVTTLTETVTYRFPSEFNVLIDMFDDVQLSYNIPMVTYYLSSTAENLYKVYRGRSMDATPNYDNIIIHRSSMAVDENTMCFLYSKEAMTDKSPTTRETYQVGRVTWFNGELKFTFTLNTNEGWQSRELIRILMNTFGIRSRARDATIVSFSRQFTLANQNAFFNNELMADIILLRPEFSGLIFMDDTQAQSITRNRIVVNMRNIFKLSELESVATASIIVESEEGVGRIRVVMRDLRSEQTANIFMSILQKMFSFMYRSVFMRGFYDSIIKMNYRRYRTAKGINLTIMDEEHVDELTENAAELSRNELIRGIFSIPTAYARTCQKANQPIIMTEVDALKYVKERGEAYRDGEVLAVNFSKFNRLFYPRAKAQQNDAGFEQSVSNRGSYILSGSFGGSSSSMAGFDGDDAVYNTNYRVKNGLIRDDIRDDLAAYLENEEAYSNRIVKFEGDEVQVLFRCDDEKGRERFPRVIKEAKNTVTTSLDENIAHDLVCCYVNPRVNKIDVKRIAAAPLHIMNSDKVVYAGRKGYLSAEISGLFENAGFNETFYRIGTSPYANVNTVLYAIKYALDLPDTVESIRHDIVTSMDIFPDVASQENADIGFDMMRDTLYFEDTYLDAMRFYRIFEEYFNVNIVVFDGNGNAVPPHTLFYTRRVLDPKRKIIILYSHKGSERDRLQIPQCEVIATDNRKVFTEPEMFDTLNAFLQYNSRVLSFTIENEGSILGRNNYYSATNYQDYFKNELEAQFIDNLGKTRALFLKNGLVVAVPATQPYNLPNVELNEKTILPELPQVLAAVDDVRSIVTREGVVRGVFVGYGDYEIYYMCYDRDLERATNSGFPLNTREPLFPITDNPSFINTLAAVKNAHFRLNHVIRYSYLLSGLSIDDYIAKFIFVDKEMDLPKIPRIIMGDTAIKVIQRIYPSGYIYVPNKATVEGIRYSLHELGATTLAEYPRVIGNYFRTKSDFRQSHRYVFFKGQAEYDAWVQTLTQNVSKNIKSYDIYTSLDSANLSTATAPFIYQRSKYADLRSSINPRNDSFFLVQNLPLFGRNDSFRMAVVIAQNWADNGYNMGPGVVPYKKGRDPASLVAEVDVVDISDENLPPFVVYTIKNGRMEEEKRFGDNGPYVEILQYNVRNTFYYAALMRLA